MRGMYRNTESDNIPLQEEKPWEPKNVVAISEAGAAEKKFSRETHFWWAESLNSGLRFLTILAISTLLIFLTILAFTAFCRDCNDQNQDTALCPTFLHFGNVTWPNFGFGLWTEPEPVAEDDISSQQSLVSEAGTKLRGGEEGVEGRGGGGGEERGGRGAGGSVLSTGGRGLSQWNGAGAGGVGEEGGESEDRQSQPSGGPVLNVWRGGGGGGVGMETDDDKQEAGVGGKTTDRPGRSSSWFFGRTTNSTTTTSSTTKDPLRADIDSVLSAVIRRINKEEEEKRWRKEEGAGMKSSSWTSWQEWNKIRPLPSPPAPEGGELYFSSYTPFPGQRPRQPRRGVGGLAGQGGRGGVAVPGADWEGPSVWCILLVMATIAQATVFLLLALLACVFLLTSGRSDFCGGE